MPMTYWLETMTCRVNEEETAMHSCIGNMPVPLRCQFLPQVSRILVFDLSVDTGADLVSMRIMTSCSGVLTYRVMGSQQPSLLIWSPYPGVSMTFSFSLTPFSTIAKRKQMIKFGCISASSSTYCVASPRWMSFAEEVHRCPTFLWTRSSAMRRGC